MRDKLFYVQDKRQYVGNDMLWWGRGNSGYVTSLEGAEIYTEEEVQHFLSSNGRDTDIVWPFDYINSISRRAVDMQYADRKKIIKKLKSARAENGKIQSRAL